jgi:hypothetical protein
MKDKRALHFQMVGGQKDDPGIDFKKE